MWPFERKPKPAAPASRVLNSLAEVNAHTRGDLSAIEHRGYRSLSTPAYTGTPSPYVPQSAYPSAAIDDSYIDLGAVVSAIEAFSSDNAGPAPESSAFDGGGGGGSGFDGGGAGGDY